MSVEHLEAMASTQSLRARIWSKLGFGRCFIPAPDDDEMPDPWCAPGRIVTEIVSHISWSDRLRILISGKTFMFVSMQTDAAVKVARSVSKFSVLPPGSE